jgi:hypothetical protein
MEYCKRRTWVQNEEQLQKRETPAVMVIYACVQRACGDEGGSEGGGADDELPVTASGEGSSYLGTVDVGRIWRTGVDGSARPPR